MPSFSREMGIDLGSSYTVIAEGKQILLHEPSVVAVMLDEWKMIEWGQAAKDMTGRVPDSIEVIYPIQHGVIAEYEITENMLKYLIRKISGPMLLFKPKIMITVPYGITSVEARAVHEAGLGAGSRDVYLIQQPLAAALGVDLPIAPPTGNMIISMGGGTDQVAVLAMNSLISAETARGGGTKIDEEIISYLRKTYGVILSRASAEQVKIHVGAAMKDEELLNMEIQGQDQVTSLPRTLNITTEDIVAALEEPLADIVTLAKRVLEKTPPELISDIMDRGVALCGGGSQLRGIENLWVYRYIWSIIRLPVPPRGQPER
jgi:rod shape-determining protein MreB